MRQASATAGLGAAFVAAATPKLRPGEGRLALVLPITLCTGSSWQQTRTLIERDFTLDTVIVSHDPTRWNFSDSTDLSEALIIATRRPAQDSANSDAAEHRVNFVNLWQNPDGVLEAHRMAQAIVETPPANVEDGGARHCWKLTAFHVGEVVSVPERKVMGGQWRGVQFARADLTRSAMRLLNDGIVWIPGEHTTAKIPLCRVSEIGEIGPDIRDVRDGFALTDSTTAYVMVANLDTEKRRSIATIPDQYLSPLSEPLPRRRLKPLELLWPRAGKLLIGARFRLNTVRVICMRSERDTLGSMWWPVRHRQRNILKRHLRFG